MRPPYDTKGVVTFECDRHPITQPLVYFNADGQQVGGPPAAITIKGGIL
jgi:hypothetical protein